MPHIIEGFFDVKKEATYLLVFVEVFLHFLGEEENVVGCPAESSKA